MREIGFYEFGGSREVRLYAGCPEPRVGDHDLLDDVEKERAARLRDPLARRRFVARRATLRRLLGAVLACPPRAVPILVQANGRPRLPAPWSFSVSTRDSYAVFSVGLHVEHAVDVERVPDPAAIPALSRLALRDDEQAPSGEALCRLWTAKEAYAKLTGTPLLEALSTARVDAGRAELWSGAARFQLHPFSFEQVYGTLLTRSGTATSPTE